MFSDDKYLRYRSEIPGDILAKNQKITIFFISASGFRKKIMAAGNMNLYLP